MPEHNRGGRVRMEEVARVAGVSLATVSRVLRQPDIVSPELRTRVMAAADRLGYAPNPLAGSLAGARSPLVGVIVPSLTNAFFARTLETMAAPLEAEGVQLMIGCHDYDPDREERIVTAFAGWRPTALVVTGADHSRGTTQVLSQAACPVIEMWDIDGRPLDAMVGFSTLRAGRLAGQAMAELGPGPVAFVGATLDRDPRARVRAQGFAERFREITGREAIIEDVPGREVGQGGTALAALLDRVPDLRGVAFSGDMLAVGALFEAQRRGLHVPDDLALLGYGDLDIAAHTNPGLSTIRPPSGEIGVAVADLILARLKPGSEAPKTVELDVDFIRRGSL